MNQERFLQKVKTKVLKEDAQATLILFGSRARGNSRPDSDWDFLIVTSKNASTDLQKRLRNDIYDIELEFLQPISTLIIDKEKWKTMAISSFYQNVTREGKVL